MKNKNLTKKYLIVSSVVFVLSIIPLIIALFFIDKEKNKVATLTSELSIATKEDVVVLKRAIRNYEESAGLVKSLLVDREKIFDFISDIENLGKSSGAVVSVQNIDLFDVIKSDQLVVNTGQDHPERIYGKFVMSLRVEGNWEQVSSFLLKLETIPKHSTIEALSLNSVFDSQTKRQSWSANFNIVTTTN